MKIAIIMNSSAGSLKGSDFSPDRIVETFKSLNIEAEVIHVTGDQIKDKCTEIIEKGPDILVAAGGDGTVSAAASAASGNKIPFGVLPLGTLNHFAKDLGIPTEMEDAAKIIAQKKLRKVDIGEVNGRLFINNSSIGIYPKMVKHRDKEKEKIGNKWIAMARALIIVFIKFPLLRIKITTETGKIHFNTPFVFIGNNQYEMNLFNLGSRTNISEGTLSIYYPLVTGRISMFRFFFHALINTLDQQKDFIIELAKGLTIETRRKMLEVSLDGEITHMTPPLNYKIRPLDLTVIVP